MRLLSIHIENYGKLRDYDRHFEQGLDVLLAPNGWGKTTLASFLCAMFYGVGDTRRKNEQSERQRYQPWEGGVYGGSMIFTVDGRRWRVLRTFGSRKREDTFYLYDDETGLPGTEYSSQLGLELFGIDAAAFRETLYQPQMAGPGDDSSYAFSNKNGAVDAGLNSAPVPALAAPSSQIRSMITDDSGEDESLRRCGEALQLLKKEADSLSPDRKNSAIGRAAERQTILQAQALAVPSLQEQADSLQQRLNAGRARLAGVDAELEQYQQRTARLGQALEARRILQEQALARQRCELAVQETARLAAELENAKNRLAEAEAEKAGREAAEAEAETARPEASGTQIGAPAISEQDLLAEISRKEAEAEGLRRQLHLAEKSSRHFSSLCDVCTTDRKESLRRIRGLRQEYQENKAARDSLRKSEDSPLLRRSTQIILGAAGILCLLLFLLLCFRDNSSAVITVAGVCAAILLAAALFLFLRARSITGKRKALEVQLRKNKQARSGLREDAGTLDEALKDYRRTLRNTHRKIEGYRTRLQLLEEELAGLRAELAALQGETAPPERVSAVLPHDSSVAGTDNFLTSLHTEIARLEQLLREAEARRDELNCGFDSERDSDQKSALYSGPDYEDTETALQEQADYADIETLSMQELTEESSALRAEQLQLRAETDALAAELDTVSARLEEALEASRQAHQLDDGISSLQKRYHILTAASDCLRQAAADYNRQFMSPFLQTFEHYCDLLRSEPIFFRSDANLALHAEAQGQPRPLAAFSAGTRDVLLLCRRLAMLDNMYRGEKPPLILDDPFVNLDDDHLEAALRLLNQLAGDRQIIYLTCHESRLP